MTSEDSASRPRVGLVLGAGGVLGGAWLADEADRSAGGVLCQRTA